MALNGYWGFPSHPLKSSNQMRLKCTVKPILSSQLPISPICSHLSFPMFPTFQWLSLYISVYYIYICIYIYISFPHPAHAIAQSPWPSPQRLPPSRTPPSAAPAPAATAAPGDLRLFPRTSGAEGWRRASG